MLSFQIMLDDEHFDSTCSDWVSLSVRGRTHEIGIVYSTPPFSHQNDVLLLFFLFQSSTLT